MVRKLIARDTLDFDGQLFLGLFSFRNSNVELHCHDFYEILFFFEGNMIHHVNSKEQKLVSGNLVFIKPEDVHSLENCSESNAGYFNLAFSEDIFEDIVQCFNLGFLKQQIFDLSMPPIVMLSSIEIESIKQRYEKLNYICTADKHLAKIELKIMAAEIISKFISRNPLISSKDVPLWLEKLCLEMKNKDNFENGIAVMSELSGKTPQHIWRAFKKYFDKSPGEYLNDIKLTYAANQLINTDRPIIDICMDTGFNSLSYFYKIFKQKYDFTPNEFRARNSVKLPYFK